MLAQSFIITALFSTPPMHRSEPIVILDLCQYHLVLGLLDGLGFSREMKLDGMTRYHKGNLPGGLTSSVLGNPNSGCLCSGEADKVLTAQSTRLVASVVLS